MPLSWVQLLSHILLSSCSTLLEMSRPICRHCLLRSLSGSFFDDDEDNAGVNVIVLNLRLYHSRQAGRQAGLRR